MTVLTHDELVSRIDEIKPELLELADSDDKLDDDQVERYNTLTAEFDELDGQLPAAKAAADRLERVRSFALKPAHVEAGSPVADHFDPEEEHEDVQRVKNPWDIEAVQRAGLESNGDELLSRALSAAEALTGASDDIKASVTRTIESLHDDDNPVVARLALATTSPAYKRAFAKLARGDEYASLSDGERDAAGEVKTLARAMSTTDGEGGYLIPTDIEPAVTLTVTGVTNPIFELARKVQTTGDTYRVVGSGAASWSWDAENAEVSDDATTFTNTDIPLYSARGFVPVSIGAMGSISNAAGIVAEVLAQGNEELVSAALATGTGSSQPTGIIVALTGGSQITASATTDTYAVADVYSTWEALGPRYRRNAAWLMNLSIIDETRQFATDDGHALLQRLGDGQPPALLGAPLHEASDLDGTYGSGDNYVAVVGDWSNFVIAQGIGTTVDFIPHVFGSTGRPIGARGFFAYNRFGCDSVNDVAFEMLNIT